MRFFERQDRKLWWWLIGCGGMVLVGVAAFAASWSVRSHTLPRPKRPGGTPPSAKAPDHSAEIEVRIETSIKPEARTSSLYAEIVPVADVWNEGFSGTRARLDRTTGALSIEFDYDGKSFDLGSGLGLRVDPCPLLIRYFDRNGEHLGHFTTEERYYPGSSPQEWVKEWKRRLAREEARGGKGFSAIALSPRRNAIAYRITTRDAAFVESCELGWCTRRLLYRDENGATRLGPEK